MNDYNVFDASRLIIESVDILSKQYINNNKLLFKQGKELDLLYETLKQYSIIIAPFAPFLAEKVY